jgi:hypothetical protein
MKSLPNAKPFTVGGIQGIEGKKKRRYASGPNPDRDIVATLTVKGTGVLCGDLK